MNKHPLPVIPDWLVTLAEIIEGFPAVEGLLHVRLNDAVAEFSRAALQYEDMVTQVYLSGPIVSLGEYYELSGRVLSRADRARLRAAAARPDPAPPPAAQQPDTPGRLLKFPGGAGV